MTSMRTRPLLVSPLVCLVLATASLSVSLSVPMSASAAGSSEAAGDQLLVDPLTGTLHGADTGAAVGGLVVQVRENDAGAPGALVASAGTESDGSFSIDASGTSTTQVWVQVLSAPRWQGGYVGGTPKYVQPSTAAAQTYAFTADLGTVRVIPAFMRGVVVDAADGDPVASARARIYAVDQVRGGTPQRVVSTSPGGVFAATGLVGDEFGVKIVGPAGYETGWLGCGYGVVPTWGDACSHGPGRLFHRVRLDRT